MRQSSCLSRYKGNQIHGALEPEIHKELRWEVRAAETWERPWSTFHKERYVRPTSSTRRQKQQENGELPQTDTVALGPAQKNASIGRGSQSVTHKQSGPWQCLLPLQNECLGPQTGLCLVTTTQQCFAQKHLP